MMWTEYGRSLRYWIVEFEGVALARGRKLFVLVEFTRLTPAFYGMLSSSNKRQNPKVRGLVSPSHSNFELLLGRIPKDS